MHVPRLVDLALLGLRYFNHDIDHASAVMYLYLFMFVRQSNYLASSSRGAQYIGIVY